VPRSTELPELPDRGVAYSSFTVEVGKSKWVEVRTRGGEKTRFISIAGRGAWSSAEHLPFPFPKGGARKEKKCEEWEFWGAVRKLGSE